MCQSKFQASFFSLPFNSLQLVLSEFSRPGLFSFIHLPIAKRLLFIQIFTTKVLPFPSTSQDQSSAFHLISARSNPRVGLHALQYRAVRLTRFSAQVWPNAGHCKRWVLCLTVSYSLAGLGSFIPNPTFNLTTINTMIRTTPPKPPKPVPEGSPAIDSDSEIHPEMEDLITEGRELTKERKFPEALRLLIKVGDLTAPRSRKFCFRVADWIISSRGVTAGSRTRSPGRGVTATSALDGLNRGFDRFTGLTRSRRTDSRLHHHRIELTFKQAVNMCPCHPAGNPPPRHKKDKSCHISHFIQALDKPDPEILFDTAKAPCPCGYVWPSCARQQHALALDALAQCLEQADQLVSAFSTALSIINLDPTSAIGYCRVATMIHALLKNMADEMPPPARSLATAIAGSGPPTMKLRGILRSFLDRSLNITTQRRRGPKGKYDVSCRRPFSQCRYANYRRVQIILQKMAYLKKVNIHKRDPVRMLPPELLHMVFAVLPMSDRL